MPQFDVTSFSSQLFWLGITFVTLFMVMSRFIIPRIHTVLENRQQRIEYDLDRAASLKAEAEQARETYEHALAEARSQAQNLLSEVSDAIRETSDAKHKELDDILSQKIAESEQLITDARIKADQDLEPTAAEVACTLTERLAGLKCDSKAMLKIVSKHNKDYHQNQGKAA